MFRYLDDRRRTAADDRDQGRLSSGAVVLRAAVLCHVCVTRQE
jgi:hypothetical protein